MSECRKAFDSWLKSGGRKRNWIRYHHEDAAWAAWQAAWSRLMRPVYDLETTGQFSEPRGYYVGKN